MTEVLNPELELQLRVNAARMIAADIREFEFVEPNGAAMAWPPASRARSSELTLSL